ncbi:MAG: hypothetical protein ACP6IP_04020 [Candidatus Njordarchaeia archaeon]
MILGYLIFDLGGALIYSKNFADISKRSGEGTFANILSGITNLLTEILDSDLRYISFQDYYLYFSIGENFIVTIISDSRDDSIFEYSKEILNEIEGLNLSPDLIQIDQNARKKVEELIDELIIHKAPPLGVIKKIVESIPTLTRDLEGDNVPLEEFPRKELKVKSAGGLLGVMIEVDVEELLKDFYDGLYEDVIIKSRSLLGGKHGDLARILYAKSSLLLNSFDWSIPTPSLQDIEAIIMGIKDDFARELLLAELRSFTEVGEYNNRRRIVLENLEKFKHFVEGEGNSYSEIYQILVAPVYNLSLNKKLGEVLDSKSEFLKAIIEETNILLETYEVRPEKISDLMSTLGRLWREHDRFFSKNLSISGIYLHMYLFVLNVMLTAKNMSFEDGLKLLKNNFKDLYKRTMKIVDEAKYLSNRHKAVLLYFTFYMLYGLLIEVGDELAEEYLDEVYEYLRKKISWLIGLSEINRIEKDMFYISISGILSILTRIAMLKGICIKNIYDVLKMLQNSNITKFWHLNQYHYAHYYLDSLEAAANTILISPYTDLKQEILNNVASAIENALNLFNRIPLVRDYKTIQWIRIFIESKDKKLESKALELFDKLKASSSEFLSTVAKRIIERRGLG